MANAQQQHFLLDIDNYLHDSAAKTSTFVGEVATVAKAFDAGTLPKYVKARLVLDLTAIDLATGDENYFVNLQLSQNTSFNDAGLVVTKPLWRFGAAAALDTAGFDSTINSFAGRYEDLVENTFAGITYRYMRLKTVLSGTSPSITYSAFLTHDHRAN